MLFLGFQLWGVVGAAIAWPALVAGGGDVAGCGCHSLAAEAARALELAPMIVSYQNPSLSRALVHGNRFKSAHAILMSLAATLRKAPFRLRRRASIEVPCPPETLPANRDV